MVLINKSKVIYYVILSQQIFNVFVRVFKVRINLMKLRIWHYDTKKTPNKGKKNKIVFKAVYPNQYPRSFLLHQHVGQLGLLDDRITPCTAQKNNLGKKVNKY